MYGFDTASERATLTGPAPAVDGPGPAPGPAPELETPAGATSWVDDLASVWDWLTGSEDVDLDVPDASPWPLSSDVYLDQRDNQTETTDRGVVKDGDVQCAPTSVAMSILARVGAAGFAAAAQGAYARIGQTRSADQLQADPEHVVWDWIYARTAEQWRSALGLGTDFPGTTDIHKYYAVMAATIEAFCDVDVEAKAGGADPRTSLESVASLPAVVGTDLTSGGHVVVVTDVLGDGVVVDDAYGARAQSEYLRNGESAARASMPPEHRFRERPDLAGVGVDEVRTDWGNDVFFTWEEVDAWDIGRQIVA